MIFANIHIYPWNYSRGQDNKSTMDAIANVLFPTLQWKPLFPNYLWDLTNFQKGTEPFRKFLVTNLRNGTFLKIWVPSFCECFQD